MPHDKQHRESAQVAARPFGDVLARADSLAGIRWAGDMGRWCAVTRGLPASAFRTYNQLALASDGAGRVAMSRRVTRRRVGSAGAETRGERALRGAGLVTATGARVPIYNTQRRRMVLLPLRAEAVGEVRARRQALAVLDAECRLSPTAWRVAHLALALTTADGAVELSAGWLATTLAVTERAARLAVSRLCRAGVLAQCPEAPRRYTWGRPSPTQLSLFAEATRGTVRDTCKNYAEQYSRPPRASDPQAARSRGQGPAHMAALVASSVGALRAMPISAPTGCRWWMCKTRGRPTPLTATAWPHWRRHPMEQQAERIREQFTTFGGEDAVRMFNTLLSWYGAEPVCRVLGELAGPETFGPGSKRWRAIWIACTDLVILSATRPAPDAFEAVLRGFARKAWERLSGPPAEPKVIRAPRYVPGPPRAAEAPGAPVSGQVAGHIGGPEPARAEGAPPRSIRAAEKLATVREHSAAAILMAADAEGIAISTVVASVFRADPALRDLSNDDAIAVLAAFVRSHYNGEHAPRTPAEDPRAAWKLRAYLDLHLAAVLADRHPPQEALA